MISAHTLVNAFLTHCIFVYGPNIKDLSGHGKQCVSKIFKDFGHILDVKDVFITIYHPDVLETSNHLIGRC